MIQISPLSFTLVPNLSGKKVVVFDCFVASNSGPSAGRIIRLIIHQFYRWLFPQHKWLSISLQLATLIVGQFQQQQKCNFLLSPSPLLHSHSGSGHIVDRLQFSMNLLKRVRLKLCIHVIGKTNGGRSFSWNKNANLPLLHRSLSISDSLLPSVLHPSLLPASPSPYPPS